MYKRHLGFLCSAVVTIVCVCVGSACAQISRSPVVSQDKTDTVAFEGKSIPVTDILTEIAKQSGQRMLIESTVASTPTSLCIQGVEFEAALDFICMQRQDMKWRKVYLPPDSALIAHTDELARAVRLTEPNGTPDVIAVSGADLSGVLRVSKSRGWPDIRSAKSAGWVELYLIANDEAAGYQKGRLSLSVQEYVQQRQLLADSFMKMSAEDKRRAAQSEVSILLQAQPAYGKAMLKSLAECADRPVQFSPVELVVFRLAKHFNEASGDSVSLDSVVKAVPQDALPKYREQLQKALAAIEARLAPAEGSSSAN